MQRLPFHTCPSRENTLAHARTEPMPPSGRLLQAASSYEALAASYAGDAVSEDAASYYTTVGVCLPLAFTHFSSRTSG